MQTEGQEPTKHATKQPGQFRGPTQGRKAARPSPATSLFLSLGQVSSREAHYSFPAEAGCQGKD